MNIVVAYTQHSSRINVITQLLNLFTSIPRICNFVLLLIVWVRSFSKIYREDKVFVFVILREKYQE